MHREAATPEILNNPNGLLYITAYLDMRTKKKTKFGKEFTQTVVLPHCFEDGKEHRIMAFCKQAEDRELAKELGAEFVGSSDLIKAISKGEIKYDDYDHIICTTDMYQDIGGLKKHLRERLPNPKDGNVGVDIMELFRFYTEGKTYEVQKKKESEGIVHLPIGTLQHTDRQIEENFQAFLEKIYPMRRLENIAFVSKCILKCPPSREEFHIREDELIPPSERLDDREEEEAGSDDEQIASGAK